MLKKIIGKIWRASPKGARALAVRLSQTTFTVSVGAIVSNGEGKILLLDHVLRPASGWGVPGGFINADEQPEVAIRREICEEIGLEIKDLKLLRVKTFRRHVEILYSAQATCDNDFAGEVKSLEIKQVKWFALEEMPKEMNRAQKLVIEEFAPGKNRG